MSDHLRNTRTGKLWRGTHHFGIAAVDDDPGAVGGGGHLAGGARNRGGAGRGKAGPSERVQGERVNIVVVDKVSAGSRRKEEITFIDRNVDFFLLLLFML